MGESQLTFNYVKAFADFINNFTFGKGVTFSSPEATSAIVPYLIKRAWEQDNEKASVLWEIGQHGAVSGDVFVKVAYEEPFQDPTGRINPGRIRILPINPAFAFPEWHPHDRSRMIRFKLKYKFWGCVDSDTEILTADGWKTYDQVSVNDKVLSRAKESDTIHWETPKAINVHEYTGGPMVRWTGQGMDALTTLNHRWLVDAAHGNQSNGENGTFRYEKEIARTSVAMDEDRAVKNSDHILTGGGVPVEFSNYKKYEDEVVETIGWFVTEGCIHTNQTGCKSVLISQKRPEGVERIRKIADFWRGKGATVTERTPDKNGVITWYFGKGAKETILDIAPNKEIQPRMLVALTHAQAELLHDTLMLADGNHRRNSARWTQTDQGRVDGYQMLLSMLGISSRYAAEKVQEYNRGFVGAKSLLATSQRVACSDIVWCPELSVATGIWMARRNGVTYWTGNTAADGARQVFTYTEIITDDMIEEFINDERIDQRPNPLGTIPVAYTQNIPVASSPWGLGDITDIITLNREFNEKASELSDIINYHGAPVTVITGAKANNLERGPKKVWTIGTKDAHVENLQMTTDFNGIMGYMELLKQAMHEMTGVPSQALGQMQPVSNTSGVALAIQYQPLMQRFSLKKTQYGRLFKRVNELIIKTAVFKEPEMLMWNPTISSVQIQPGQYPQLDPNDPITYETSIHWADPLPVDALIKINEIQARMGMGLESKRGALKALGEMFPDQKLTEIHEELVEDLKSQAAMNLVQAQAAQFIIQATGMTPEGQPLVLPGVQGPPGADGAPGAMAPAVNPMMAQEIMSRAYGVVPAERTDFDTEP